MLYTQINAFIADYWPVADTKVDGNTQYGMDNGVLFLVIHGEQKDHGIYQWRFTQAAGGLTISKNVAIATGNAISKALQSQGLPIDLSWIAGDPLRNF